MFWPSYATVKYFRWGTTIQIGHAIDTEGKVISLVKQLSGKFSIVDFCLKVQKRGFTSIFIPFLSSRSSG